MTPKRNEFKVALAIAGINITGFARQHGVSRPLVSMILSRRAKSKRIEDAMSKFTDEQLLSLNLKRVA